MFDVLNHQGNLAKHPYTTNIDLSAIHWYLNKYQTEIETTKSTNKLFISIVEPLTWYKIFSKKNEYRALPMVFKIKQINAELYSGKSIYSHNVIFPFEPKWTWASKKRDERSQSEIQLKFKVVENKLAMPMAANSGCFIYFSVMSHKRILLSANYCN